MFVIEALHHNGCSDRRNYRILNEDSNEIVALINTSSCRVSSQPAAMRQRSPI